MLAILAVALLGLAGALGVGLVVVAALRPSRSEVEDWERFVRDAGRVVAGPRVPRVPLMDRGRGERPGGERPGGGR